MFRNTSSPSRLIIVLILLLSIEGASSPLEVLGFASNEQPSKDQIKQRFKQLSLKHHPDRIDSSSLQRYEQIVNAYQLLKKQNFRQTLQNNRTQQPDFGRFFHQMQWDFILITPEPEQSGSPLELSIDGFFNWCLKNPKIILGAFLISMGVINLLT